MGFFTSGGKTTLSSSETSKTFAFEDAATGLSFDESSNVLFCDFLA